MPESTHCMNDTGKGEAGARIQPPDLPGIQAEHSHAKI